MTPERTSLESTALSPSIFQRLRLGHKFTFLLAFVFIVGTIISAFVLGQVLERRAEAEVIAQGELLSEFQDAVRGYTSEEITPLLSAAPSVGRLAGAPHVGIGYAAMPG